MLEQIRTLKPDRVRSVLAKHLNDYVFGAIQGPNMPQKINLDRLLNPQKARKALKKKKKEESAPAPSEQ